MSSIYVFEYSTAGGLDTSTSILPATLSLTPTSNGDSGDLFFCFGFAHRASRAPRAGFGIRINKSGIWVVNV